MSAEIEFNISRPRTEKTFFPYNNEARGIWESTLEEIREGIAIQPDLTFQYIHELWRTGRDGVIFDLLLQDKVNVMEFADPVENFTKLATLRVFGNESLENCKIFLTDFYTLFCKVACGLDFDGSLKPEIVNKIQEPVTSLMEMIAISANIVRSNSTKNT